MTTPHAVTATDPTPTRKPLITTSWDDGHPLDLRLAEMLSRHGLTGTFYVPRRDKRPVMSDAQVRSLADAGFEIGAHTIDHVVLTATADDQAALQIADSRRWISDVIGRDCPMFCPPCGKHTARHVRMIHDAGYSGYRTVELWSTDRPRTKRAARGGLLELPTSIQVQPHGMAATLRNLLKRRAARNAWSYLRHGLGGDWTHHAAAMIDAALQRHGVFHLWGHSWEIHEQGQWDRLEQVLGLLGTYRDRADVVTNFGVCTADRRGSRPSV